MKILIIIGSGGFIGCILRYLVTQFIQNKFLSDFPFGTLGVNIIGCFIAGIIFGLSEKISMSNEWQLFLIAGICGGFTTFSAFSIETITLIRDGNLLNALSNIGASIILGLSASFAGISLLKLF